jgi:hypothetical protein
MGRRLLSIVVAAALGALLGFAIHDLTQSDRPGGNASYTCPNSMVHDFLHPAKQDLHLRGLAFDSGPPCDRQARFHVFGWTGVFVVIATSLVLAVTLERRLLNEDAGP